MLGIDLLPSCSSLDDAKSLVLGRLKDLETRGLSPRFRRYLEPHLRRIIKGRWPLDYWLVRDCLVKPDLESFEDQLQCLEQVLDAEGLERMFGENRPHRNRPLSPPDFSSKLKSFHAEADCVNFLCKIGSHDIKRLHEHGDWEFRLSKKILRAEVKNVQAYDFHLECVGEALFGEMSLVSSALRNYREVFIEAKDIKEEFRNVIIGIVHENLPFLLAHPADDGAEKTITVARDTKVVCCWFTHADGSEAAEVEISTPTGGRCSIEFKPAIDFPDLVSASIHSSDDTWWGNRTPDWTEVGRKIQNRVCDALEQLTEFPRALIFIRLNLHPRFEDNIRTQKERLTEVLGPTLGMTDQPLIIEVPCYFGQDRFQFVFNKGAGGFEKLWARVT